MGGATKNNVSTAHLGERFLRHPLTGRNLKELNVAERASAILERDKDKLKSKAEKKTPDGKDRYITPTGFSLNKGRFGDFPDAEITAHQRGWQAYMTVGVPLVEERGDITQPPPDVISKQTYVNRTDPTPTSWSHTVEFSISNVISWSLQGQIQLTFGAKVAASLQQQLQKSLALNQSQKSTAKNSKDNIGFDAESQAQTTTTTTATGSATGTGELSAQLMLGITASVSGSLTTSFKTSSTLSGEVASRVDVLATQRRQVRRFDYEFPVSFGGWVALYYPEPVEVKELRPDGPQPPEPKYSKVIAWKLGETGGATTTFNLTDAGKPFTQKGEAEVVSTLAGIHEAFELETINFNKKDHPLHKDGEEEAVPKKATVEIAAGFGTADGLALDLANQKAYITDRSGGKLYKVDLVNGRTDWVLDKLGQPNDVALDLPGNKAYVTDYSGRRLFTVSLSNPSASSVVTIAQGIAAYGVALDLSGNKAYVADVDNAKLNEFDLSSQPAQKQRVWSLSRAAGVELDRGKAYLGQYDYGGLYEVDLRVVDAESPQAVATNLGTSVRLAPDGAVNTYVSDSSNGRLHEVVVADGEAKGRQRVVADALGTVCGLALDRDNAWIYVTNRQGKLLRLSGVLPDAASKS